MKLEYFPQFIKLNYPQVGELPAAEVEEIGIAFKAYLENSFEGKMEKLEEIWDIRPETVIMNMGHPLRMKGYHPALILHFTQFIDKEAKKFMEANPEQAAEYIKELEDEKNGKEV